MTIQKIKIGLAGLMGMFLITSCISDAEKQHGNPSLTAFGDIIREEGSVNIVLDNYDTLKVSNPSTLDIERYRTGTRLYFMAEITYRNNKQPFELYKGNLIAKDSVEVKQPLLLSEVTEEDNLGMDKIDIKQIMITGKYLTTKFSIRQNDGKIKHTISYVIDDTAPVDKGVLNIKIRHNENGDTPSISYTHMMSCDILKYLKEAPNGKLKVNVYFDSTSANDQMISYDWNSYPEWYLANK